MINVALLPEGAGAEPGLLQLVPGAFAAPRRLVVNSGHNAASSLLSWPGCLNPSAGILLAVRLPFVMPVDGRHQNASPQV